MNVRSSIKPSVVFHKTLGFLLVATICACQSGASSDQPKLPEPKIVQLRSDWRDVEPFTFEHLVEGLFASPSPTTFDAPTIEALNVALEGPAPENVRAAVLLSHSGTPECVEILLQRLEQRVSGPDRSSDAGDVVAAAGLASLNLQPDQKQRLVPMATGGAPHPDLEVRVEIARTALRHGQDQVIPFLISVLRIGTRASRQSGEFWPAPLRSAWARERAAEILSWRSGLEQRFSADASISDRETEALRYEEALLDS